MYARDLLPVMISVLCLFQIMAVTNVDTQPAGKPVCCHGAQVRAVIRSTCRGRRTLTYDQRSLLTCQLCSDSFVYCQTAGFVMLSSPWVKHGLQPDRIVVFRYITAHYKFLMRPIYGYPEKFRESWRANGYFSRNLSWAFVSINTKNVRTKLEVRSFTRSLGTRGYGKKFGQSPDTPTHPFLQNFKGAFVRMAAVNTPAKFEFVALPVPEIMGGTQKIGAGPGYAHAPFSPKFFMGFCSDGPCEYTCQLWSS